MRTGGVSPSAMAFSSSRSFAERADLGEPSVAIGRLNHADQRFADWPDADKF
jgi:hypothetical protein